MARKINVCIVISRFLINYKMNPIFIEINDLLEETALKLLDLSSLYFL